MVKKYKRTDKLQLSKNFRLEEFKCKCGKCDPILVDDALITRLQQIRDHFGKPVNVNSGYRCAKHNADPKVGGAAGSHHVKGMAADIRVEGILPEEVAKYAESIGIQRIGLYDNFVHIGSGTTKKFWINKGTNEVSTFGGKPEPKTITLELPVLRRGMKGEAVMTLQILLNGKDAAGLDVDGSLGKDTEKAVIDFQKANDMKPGDGVCGGATWSKLLGLEAD